MMLKKLITTLLARRKLRVSKKTKLLLQIKLNQRVFKRFCNKFKAKMKKTKMRKRKKT